MNRKYCWQIYISIICVNSAPSLMCMAMHHIQWKIWLKRVGHLTKGKISILAYMGGSLKLSLHKRYGAAADGYV